MSLRRAAQAVGEECASVANQGGNLYVSGSRPDHRPEDIQKWIDCGWRSPPSAGVHGGSYTRMASADS